MRSNYRFLVGLAVLGLCWLFTAVSVLAGPGYALSFNGTDNYVTANIPVMANNYTVSAWVNLRSGGQWFGSRTAVLSAVGCGDSAEVLIHSPEDGSSPQHLFLGRCNYFNGTNSILTIPSNQWTHVVVTVSASNQVSYFINGLAAGSWDGTGWNFSLGGNICLAYNQGTGRKFDGLLDEVQVWSRALSQAEIQANMNQAPNVADPNLVAYWPFSEGGIGTNTTTADASGHGHTGTLVNAPAWVLSPVKWTPNLQLNGANPLVSRLNASFSDPGVTLTTPVSAVAAGDYYSLALKTDGTVVGWGNNLYGQTNGAASVTNAVAVAAGWDHSLALKTDGSVVAWGYNGNGQTSVPEAATNVVAIAAGLYHSLALKSDGTVVGWGSSDYRETSLPASATNVVAVAAGFYSSLVLKADGTVAAWGYNGYNLTNVPASVTNGVAISEGYLHSMVLRADGTVVAWGYGIYGQTNVPALATNIVAIAAGGLHCLALKADGVVVAWGDNTYGQTNVPASVTNVVAISAGIHHSLALRADGSVVAWGEGIYGETNVPSFAQTRFADNNPVNTNVAGMYTLTYSYTNNLGFVVATNRTVAVVDAAPVIVSQPASLTALVGAVAQLNVSATGVPRSYQWYWQNHGAIAGATNAALAWSQLAVSNAGIYYVVVSNPLGSVTSRKALVAPQTWQLNGASPVTNQLYAAFTDPGVALTTPVVAIAAGGYHNLVLKADGTVVAWGWNQAGQTDVPASATNVVSVAAGFVSSMVLKTDGSVVAWGMNEYVPVSGTNMVAVATGYAYDLALKADGTVAAWGANDFGQMSVPASATNVVSIVAGSYHGLALKADGTVVAWGRNSEGQTNVPASVTNVVAVAAGGNHSLALKADGMVVAWGDRGNDVPVFVTNVVAIATGDYHSLALKADGSVVAWGDNSYTQTSVPASATNVVAISAGVLHSLALKADGSVVAWGYSISGEGSVPSFVQTVLAASGTVNTNVVGTYTLTYSYTNSLGAVVSTNRTVVVAQTVFAPPILANLAVVGGSIGFTISGDFGQTVVVETCTNLAAPVWVPVQTNSLGGSPVNFSELVQPQQPSRFYRLRNQ